MTNKPIINASGSAFAGKDGVIKWTSNAAANYYNNNVINGLIIQNAIGDSSLRGIWINGNSNIVKNCELYDIKRSGIVVQGDSNTINDNIVDGIIGNISDSSAGNNISVESYYQEIDDKWEIVIVRRNSQFNIIKNNTLINNPTLYGVNIFPNQLDNSPQYMYGNMIYNNLIDSCYGGIFLQMQKNFEIHNNVISRNKKTNAVEGNGIHTHPHPYNNLNFYSNCKIYNNIFVRNNNAGILNSTFDSLIIRNNIFLNNGYGGGTNSPNHINMKTTNGHTISNNLYFGTGSWRWGGGTTNIDSSEWLSSSGEINSIFTKDPNLIDEANGNYKLNYNSPAKNKGYGLYAAGITTDYYASPRPYWNKDFDIGAYEINDAQFKVGVTGAEPNQPVTHIIKAYGTYWERNSDGSFPISSDGDIDSAAYTTIGNTSGAKENWRGFTYDWIYPETADSNSKWGAAFYKITNSIDTSVYFYLDARDAITSYSPNVYIEFDAGAEPKKYNYFNGVSFVEIPNDIIRIWDIAVNGNPATGGLASYWSNALVAIPRLNEGTYEPGIAWGPHPDFEEFGFKVYSNINTQGGGPGTFGLSETISDAETYEWQHEGLAWNGSWMAYYKVTAYNSEEESDTTNMAEISANGFYKEATELSRLSYSLSQNYPNPFNPSTTISFSIAADNKVEIKLFDILGREVRILINQELKAGKHQLIFNAGQFASGVYFYRITAGKYSEVKKLQLLK